MPGMMTSASSQSPLMLPSSAPMHSYDEGFLRNALQAQIEFYFSPQNLANDTYLHSQMDAHRFVFISVIAEFKMVKKLTSDFKFIVDTIRRSHALELSDDCFKVRSNCKRSQRTTIILRNIASDIPIEEVSALFEHEQCAKVINLRSDIGNTWFVTFEGEEACLQTAHFLQKQMFRGKPLQLCVKSQNPVRTYYELPPTFPPLPMMPVVDTAYTQRPIDPHWPSPPLMPSFYTPPSAMLYPMPPVRRTPLNTNQGIISHTRPQAHYASPNPAAPSPTSSNPAAINNIPDTQLPPNAVPTPSSSNPPLWRGEDINIPPPPPLPLPPQHPLPPQQQQQQHQQQQHLPQHPPQQQHHPQHHHHQQQHLPPQHQQHHHHHHHPNVFLNADGRTMVASALPTIPGAMPVPSFPDFNHVRQERRMHSQPRADYRPRRNNGGNNGVSGRAKNVNTRNGARKKNKNPGGARRNDNASDSMGETHADAVTRRDNIALGPENFPALPSSSNRSGGFHAPVVTATRERRASLVIRAATATASAAVNATTVVNTRSVGVNVVGEPPGQASNTHHTAASITESSTSTQQRGETSHLSNVSVASSTRHSVSTNTISVTPPEQHSRSNTLPKVTTPNNVNTSHHSNRNNHTSNGGAPSVAIAESSDEATPSLTSPDLSSSSSSSKPPLSYAEMARRTKAARVAAAAQLANVAVAVVTTVPRTTNESETRTQTSSPQVASTTSVNATANTTNISPPNK